MQSFIHQEKGGRQRRLNQGEDIMSKPSKSARATRRNFLKVAAAAATASAVAAPNVVSAQGVISMRWQSTWPSKDIFHEYALDYAKMVNDMTGGDLKIEVLPAGAVVPRVRAARRGVERHARRRPRRARLPLRQEHRARAVGIGPGFGMDGNMLLAWHQWGGGKELLAEALCVDRRQRRLVPLRAHADPAARLVQEADHQGGGLQGH